MTTPIIAIVAIAAIIVLVVLFVRSIAQVGASSLNVESAPIAVLLRKLSPAVSLALEAWAQQEDITTVAELGEDLEDLERLEQITGIGPTAIPKIKIAWVKDNQRIAQSKLVELSPVQTAINWGVALIVLAIITFGVSLMIFSWEYGVGIVLMSLIALGALLWAQRQSLENEHVGIVQLFGRRMFSFPILRVMFVASEGIHFAISGVVDFEIVNLLLRPLLISPVKGWSKDHDPIRVCGTITIDGEDVEVSAVVTFHVVDIVRFTSIDWEAIIKTAFPARVKEVIRAETRELKTKAVLSGRQLEQRLSNAVERSVNIAAWQWGIAIADDGVFIPSVDVGADIRSEMEAQAKDVRYREAMKEFFDAFAGKHGLEGDELLRHFRVHRGEATETVDRKIQMLAVEENTLAGFVKLLQAWLTRSSTP